MIFAVIIEQQYQVSSIYIESKLGKNTTVLYGYDNITFHHQTRVKKYRSRTREAVLAPNCHRKVVPMNKILVWLCVRLIRFSWSWNVANVGWTWCYRLTWSVNRCGILIKVLIMYPISLKYYLFSFIVSFSELYFMNLMYNICFLNLKWIWFRWCSLSRKCFFWFYCTNCICIIEYRSGWVLIKGFCNRSPL